MADQFVGEIRLFAFARVPTGWLACDGSSQPISNFDALFVLIGTTFGGDGVTTFNLPDLRGRVPISQGTGANLTARTLGEKSGEENHTLIDVEMPSHGHALVSTTTPGTTAQPGPSVHLAAGNPTTTMPYAPQAEIKTPSALATSLAIAGQSTPHNNMMPTLTGNFCIAYDGVFPSPS